ncbi:hypothetical protein ARMGADRAFT_920338 [Armillaria gallica]|uniref:Uncharacterized protein n=1 Tax=Armillaria gallica TaxID=47427 RepID=A0A2H3DWA4_ARMGA|nr:hypothetical protein ARMGADRAFT_920338 [Armillaria gallica]
MGKNTQTFVQCKCGWAATNALAVSTKEMGPGAHRDTLDDHFGDYNQWRKIIILSIA